MRIDTSNVKYDVHNVAYDPGQRAFVRWPLSICNVPGESHGQTAISLHKWSIPDGTNRGDYIALVPLCDHGKAMSVEDADAATSRILSLYREYGDGLIRSIEGATLECPGLELVYFKWSVNVWRQVKKPRSKWAYVGTKPDRGYCTIERILQT